MHSRFQDHPINHIVTLQKDIQDYYNAYVKDLKFSVPH
jgi:hypothetical protein